MRLSTVLPHLASLLVEQVQIAADASPCGRLGPAVSHDTILRVAAEASAPDAVAPRVVGIDDFAVRRGLTYGTLIVDLERRRPIEVLPDLAYRLAQDFATLVRERQGERLDAWVERAVRAGLSEPWSNGQTEGQVNRLKLLKRQSYGRAGLALLRRRVLAVACGGAAQGSPSGVGRGK